MSVKLRKTAILFVVVIALAGSGWGLHKWLTNYYRPMRDARPILQMLERGTQGDLDATARSLLDARPILQMLERGTLGDLEAVENTLSDGLRLSEPGASKVRQAVLRHLENTADEERFFYIARIIWAGHECNRLNFQGEDEWAIIKAAVERNNALPGVVRTFNIWTTTNGVKGLGFGLRPKD